MTAAPPSCRAATNRTPAAVSALVTWKLPLPTRPKARSAPRSASTRPTASATRIALPDEREYPARAARAAHDRQRRDDQHRTAGREPVDVAQLGQPVLAGAEQVRVARERRVERVGEAGVGTHRLHADTDDRPFLGEPAGAVDRDAGRVAGVGELVGVVAAAVPAGAVQQPAALGQRTVLGLPGGDVVDGQ